MVSRVYHHQIQPYLRPNGGGRPPVSAPGAEEEKRPPNWGGQQGFNSQQQSGGLATVAEQSRQNKIQLGTILQDFRSTMDALGADADVQAEVDAYLSVVAMQSRKETPAVPFIRQTLKTAADSLDGFISNALNQPSRVVRDWVEALLLQNIDYKDTTGGAAPVPEAPNPVDGAQTKTVSEKPVSEDLPGAAGPNPEEKHRIKDWVRQGRELSRQDRSAEALDLYRKALDALEGGSRPNLEGKVAQLSGREYEKAKRYDEALVYYHQASLRFSEAGQPVKQAQAEYAMAGIHDVRGELAQAQTHYESALNLVRQGGDPRRESRILNDLGVLYLRRHQNVPARQMLEQAAVSADGPLGEAALLPDIYSNLGALYRLEGRYKQAAGAYRQSLDAAHRQNDRRGYRDTLLSFADLYDEAGRPEKAAAMRERARRLGT